MRKLTGGLLNEKGNNRKEVENMNREQDDIRTNKMNSWMNVAQRFTATTPQHSEVQNVQQNNTTNDVDTDEFESSPVKVRPEPPIYGPAI